jgi:hypothetical protein
MVPNAMFFLLKFSCLQGEGGRGLKGTVGTSYGTSYRTRHCVVLLLRLIVDQNPDPAFSVDVDPDQKSVIHIT